MIEKMKFLSITGPKNDIDRVVDTYISKHEIHLENALYELSNVHDLKPYAGINPYKESLGIAEDLIKQLQHLSRGKVTPMDGDNITSSRVFTPEEAAVYVTKVHNGLSELYKLKESILVEKEKITSLINQIEPFRGLNYEINDIFNFKFIKFRFGKISHEYFERMSKYVYEDLNTVFFECDSDEHYIWGIYFVPASLSVKIDAVYSSFHFERIYLPDEYEGTPEEAHKAALIKIRAIYKEENNINSRIVEKISTVAEELRLAHEVLLNLSKNYDIRKLAACTKERQQVFYILCGWMTESGAELFSNEIEDDPNVYVIIEDDTDNVTSSPPTKLKNPPLFKPFEMFINMYGLPAYNEFDPTIFVSLTYVFIFGMMFGDLGQGLCLFLGGLFLYRKKKLALAAIISFAGIFSSFFGLMYGSLFGYEDILKPIWLSPMEHATNTGFMGNLKTILVVAVLIGVMLIIVSMFLNIFNAIKDKDKGRLFFDANGIAGLIFYVTLITTALLAITGKPLPAGIILFVIILIPLLAIMFKEPLTHLVEKKDKIFPDNKAMFFLESFFEMFEILLSYITNTISYVRIGAFALSHAGMMHVVLLLAGATDPSKGTNMIVIILGNIVISLLEGFIVGIQVLRLEYFEMFSRFYKGTGRPFKPYLKNN